MKKLLGLFVLCLLLPLQACATEKWQEGKHYVVLDKEATDKPEVAEFFSFWCPHCYNFEPFVAQIKAKLPADIPFKKVHVNFMRFAGPDVQDAATRAMVIGRELEREDALNLAIFKYIHEQRAPITNLNDLRNLFLVSGVEDQTFDKLATSFAIDGQVQKNNRTVEEYRKHIRGVPTVIVNGKYVAQFARGMSNDDYVELVLWLTKKS